MDVVAAFIKKGEKFLICRRNKNKSSALLWEFPGGKIEEMESKKDAITREIKEELSVDVKVKREILKVSDENINLYFMECEIINGEIVLNEHEDARWIDFFEADKFEFCKSDRKFIEIMKN